MQGIYTYIPETNYVPREYSVAAILLLLFMVLISLVPVFIRLYFYISTFRSMRAVPNVAVFCSSLTSCFPGMLITYFLNDFEIVPVAPIINGITFVFTFHYYYYYYSEYSTIYEKSNCFDLYIRHLRLCIRSQVYIYSMSVTYHNIKIFILQVASCSSVYEVC